MTLLGRFMWTSAEMKTPDDGIKTYVVCTISTLYIDNLSRCAYILIPSLTSLLYCYSAFS